MTKFFRKLWIRFFIRVSRKIHPSIESLEENEKLASAICRTLIKHPESTFLIAPLSQKRYIKNDESNIFVIIQGRTVQIINHIYSYSIHLDEKTYERVMATFNHEQEKRCLKLESEVEVNIKHSLKNIINNLQN